MNIEELETDLESFFIKYIRLGKYNSTIITYR
jgi:hypothetical protein